MREQPPSCICLGHKMKVHCLLAVVCIIITTISFQPGLSTYLSYPRIHFYGQFRADTNTRNNQRCNYRTDNEIHNDTNDVDWGFNGTNEFQFFDTEVTSVVYDDGSVGVNDPIIGHDIFSNLQRPYAKITDLDVDDQAHSTIYGMKNFGIKWSEGFPEEDNDIAFKGELTRSVIVQSMWPRMKCYSQDNPGDELYQDSFHLSSQSTTTIANVEWINVDESEGLSQLQMYSGGGDLAVRLTIQYYTRNYPPHVRYNATLGYVYGVIGVPGEYDTSIPGDRVMDFVGNLPTGLTFEAEDLCYDQVLENYHPWTFRAPFEVDDDADEVRVDLSNSIPSNLGNLLRNIGNLQLGVQIGTCIHLLGDEYIDYDSDEDFPITSGIYTVAVSPNIVTLLDNSPLLLVQITDDGDGQTICSSSIFPSISESHTALILLQESPYFVRPRGYYVDRLDRIEHDSSTMTLYVSKFGAPAPNIVIEMNMQEKSNDGGSLPLPTSGITLESSTETTDSDGYADFIFNLGPSIPPEREYFTAQCADQPDPSEEYVLPIDGQTYTFSFCIIEADGVPVNCSSSDISLSFLAFSDIEAVFTPTWVDNVGPILSQYARLSTIMNMILDMSSYADVTKPHNIKLMRQTMMLDIEDPSYMPTTRDLSPAKRDMILAWLDNPLYGASDDFSLPETCEPPSFTRKKSAETQYERCGVDKRLRFKDDPDKLDGYFARIRKRPHKDTQKLIAKRGFTLKRPLYGRVSKDAVKKIMQKESKRSLPPYTCSKELVKTQLQTAMELELGTLPPYLTALYSIVDGCNREIYDRIRSVAMQEMLHFTQAGNILIALNGHPVIDSASVIPTYPTALPGFVLPDLTVSIRKLSREHIHNVFMGIEIPEESQVAGEITAVDTIGVFYEEIKNCINSLSDDDFDPSTLPIQVEWPYDIGDIGQLFKVYNKDSALEAIDFIVAQGEGSHALDPYAIDNDTLAHFFKFEEIVCGNHIVEIDEDSYAYSGLPIEFNSEGVWPMRDNPRSCDIPPDTNCYTESKVFQEQYRSFLRKLDRVFNSHPQEIFDAVTSMESLQVHAKKLMWTKFNPDDDSDPTTCGPVWDYTWLDTCPDEN